MLLKVLLCLLAAAPALATPSNGSASPPPDLTPPTVTLTKVPAERTTTAPKVSLTGLVADRLSGVDYVTCNGVATRVRRGIASCTVPLQPGLNAVVMMARDRAGNVASSGVMITRRLARTARRMSPASHTVPVGEPDYFLLTDDSGTSEMIQGASWTSSNPEVASLSDDPYPYFKPLKPGTTTITATKDGLMAQATVTVTNRPAPGDTRWSIPPATTWKQSYILHGTGFIGTPDMFHVEVADSGSLAVVRAIGTAAHGQVEWQAMVPGRPVIGDHEGGVVAVIQGSSGRGAGLIRIGGNEVRPWRYEPDGEIQGAPRMGADGTLYFVERGPARDSERELYFVAMDGSTGTVTGRVTLPRSVVEHEPNRRAQIFPRACRATYSSTPVTVTQPVLGSDGRAYVQVVQLRRRSWGSCAYRDDGAGSKAVDNRLLLIGLEPGGQSTVRTVFADVYEGRQSREDVTPRAGDISPDALDGLLLTWDTDGATGRMLTRLDADGKRQDATIGSTDTLAMITAGPGKDWHATLWLITEVADLISAVDIPTLAPRWSVPATGAFPLAGIDHRAILLIESGAEPSLIVRRRDGTVDSRTEVALRNATVLTGLDLVFGIGGDGSLRAVVLPPLPEEAYSLQLKGPDPGPTGCAASRYLFAPSYAVR